MTSYPTQNKIQNSYHALKGHMLFPIIISPFNHSTDLHSSKKPNMVLPQSICCSLCLDCSFSNIRRGSLLHFIQVSVYMSSLQRCLPYHILSPYTALFFFIALTFILIAYLLFIFFPTRFRPSDSRIVPGSQ